MAVNSSWTDAHRMHRGHAVVGSVVSGYGGGFKALPWAIEVLFDIDDCY